MRLDRLLEKWIIFTEDDDDDNGWSIVHFDEVSGNDGHAEWDTGHRWRFWDTWRFIAYGLSRHEKAL